MARVVNNTTTSYSTIGVATTLGWENDECARTYMQQLQIRGHAILSAHHWKIKHLKEFYPRSARLLGLNVNKGDEVCVRFRAPGAKQTFLPFHEVLCTLIHEIAHCKYSRHDKYFWQLYAQLAVESERLEFQMTSRMTLESINQHPGFMERSRLGESLLTPASVNGDPALMRQLLADAARRRLEMGQREERDGCTRDNTSNTNTNTNTTTSNSNSSSNNGLNDNNWICQRCGNVNISALTVCGFCSDILGQGENEEGWDCRRCAFHNYCNLQYCEACNCTRRAPPQSSVFRVQKISVLTEYVDYFSAYTLLGRLADALDPLLHERQWKVESLSEFYPQTINVMSQCEVTTTSGSVVVNVRLRSPNTSSEMLPTAYVYSAVVHQLAHLVVRNHGVLFFKAWFSLLQHGLLSNEAQVVLSMGSDVRSSLHCFTEQLHVFSETYGGDGESLSRLRPFVYNLLCADCGTAVKRERSPTDAEMTVGEQLISKRPLRKWMCTRCSFLNQIGGFLFCEMCGASRSLCTLANGMVGVSQEEPVTIVDDDVEELCSVNSYDVVVVL
ncbi:WLM domain [Trypanosoma melophagium]|uniref:WLM domain n=1 Tax=Trypanosoma melophagium TaxID=715481 RepID=UPI00351A2732|nr:WLM domain [Trypanosoma melophagium]